MGGLSELQDLSRIKHKGVVNRGGFLASSSVRYKLAPGINWHHYLVKWRRRIFQAPTTPQPGHPLTAK